MSCTIQDEVKVSSEDASSEERGSAEKMQSLVELSKSKGSVDVIDGNREEILA